MVIQDKRRLEKEDHFELKEAIDDFLSRSLDLKDAESRIKEMFRLAEGESVANPEEMNKFPELIKRLKSANIPAIT